MSGWEGPNLIILPSILKVVITQKYTLLSVELRVKGRQVAFNNKQKWQNKDERNDWKRMNKDWWQYSQYSLGCLSVIYNYESLCV